MNENINIIKILLIYYLINLNTTSTLLSKQTLVFLKDNRSIKHIIALLTIFLLINIFYENLILADTIVISLIIYLLFIFSTKLDIQWNIIIFCALFVGYIYEKKIYNFTYDTNKDNVLSSSQKEEIIANNKKHKNYLYISLSILLCAGVMCYTNKKEVQYGGSYNLINFIFN
jgi:hypothetical protein